MLDTDKQLSRDIDKYLSDRQKTCRSCGINISYKEWEEQDGLCSDCDYTRING